MDSKTQEICSATNRFYAENASSFSGTRQHPWSGWEHLMPHLEHLPTSFTLLDIACGNLRFERFLGAKGMLPSHTFAVDQCIELLSAEAPKEMPIERIQADVIAALDGPHGFESLGYPHCDLVVAFGFMHHLPTFDLRKELLTALLTAVNPRGICAISFWQFGKDEKLMAKAEATTARAERELGIILENANDHFLGWQENSKPLRFCHDFSDEEINTLKRCTEEQGVAVVDDFCADGKNGNLNRYLVLRRR